MNKKLFFELYILVEVSGHNQSIYIKSSVKDWNYSIYSSTIILDLKRLRRLRTRIWGLKKTILYGQLCMRKRRGDWVSSQTIFGCV